MKRQTNSHDFRVVVKIQRYVESIEDDVIIARDMFDIPTTETDYISYCVDLAIKQWCDLMKYDKNIIIKSIHFECIDNERGDRMA